MSAPCPPEAQLEQLLDDRLEAAADSAVARHVETCPSCQDRLEQLSAGSLPSLGAAPTEEIADVLLMRLKQRGRRGDETVQLAGAQAPADRTGAEPVALPEVPGYEVMSEIGRGGMGVIYKARHLRLGRVVALKMILAGVHAHRETLRRFHIEAAAVARLAHAGIVGVYDVGEHDGLPYLSLELVEGGSLKQHLARIPQPPRASAHLVEQLARAVQHAHDAGIVHRDLKPANVLLEGERRGVSPPVGDAMHRRADTAPLAHFIPKITDFGLAKLLTEGAADGPTQTGAVVGTPGYMAPEQAAGNQRQVGPAVDVYALGAILYECLTGRPPFQAATPLDTLMQVMHEEPVSISRLQPRVPRDLATIAMRCLEKLSVKRYASARDLADDLGRFLAGQPIHARRVGPLERGWRWCRRHPGVAGLLALVLLVLVAGFAVSLAFGLDAQESARLARTEEGLARAAEKKATEQATKAQAAAYQARLVAAQARIEGHSVREAAEQLDKAPEQLRGWEWSHLESRLDESVAVVGAPGSNPELLPAAGHVVLTSKDHHVSLWDADNHRLRDLDVGGVRAVASSRTGSLVFVERRADGALLSFDDAGRPGPSFDAHGPFNAFAAALSADGKQLALGWSTGTTHTVALFDPATGAVLGVLPPPQMGSAILGLAFSPDGKHLLAATWGANLNLWDVPERRHLVAWHASNWTLWHFGFSPDGRHILSTGSDATCTQWDVPAAVSTGPPPGRPLELFGGAQLKLHAIAYSPDGKSMATGGEDGVLRVLNAESGKVVAELHGHTDTINRVAYSPDGRSLWTASDDGTARRWEVGGHSDPRVLRSERYVYGVAYSPDGRWFASAGWHDAGGHPSAIHLWDAASAQRIALLHGHPDWVASLAITPDGKRLASLDRTGSIRVWDTADGRGRKLPLAVRDRATIVAHRISISPDGRLLAVPDRDQVRLWDLHSDKEEAALSTSLTGLRIAVFSPDGARLAVVGDRPEVQIVRMPKGELLAVLRGHTHEINGVSFSPDGSRILTGGYDRSVRLWDAATGELQTVLGGAKGGHTDTIFAAVFHPDGKRIATGGRDRAIRIWDTASGEELVRLAGHTDYVMTLAFRPDGKTLVSGSGDGTVRLWDTAPLRERYQARRELEKLRPAADALVDRLLRQGGGAAEVVEGVRRDRDLSEPLRRAAWHAVLRRAEAAKQ